MTPLLLPPSPSPFVFLVTSQTTLHPIAPSRKPACPNFLRLQHHIHPLYPVKFSSPTANLHHYHPNASRTPSATFWRIQRLRCLHCRMSPAVHRSNRKGCSGTYHGRSCPFVYAYTKNRPAYHNDLDLKSLFNPIPTTITTPVSVNLLCNASKFISYLLEGFTNGFN